MSMSVKQEKQLSVSPSGVEEDAEGWVVDFSKENLWLGSCFFGCFSLPFFGELFWGCRTFEGRWKQNWKLKFQMKGCIKLLPNVPNNLFHCFCVSTCLTIYQIFVESNVLRLGLSWPHLKATGTQRWLSPIRQRVKLTDWLFPYSLLLVKPGKCRYQTLECN